MLKRKKSVVGIEILPEMVNIIEGVYSSRQIKVINYALLSELPETNELLINKIAATLKEMGVKSKIVHLAIHHPHIDQEYLQLPNLSKKEAVELVTRQVRKKKEALRESLKQDDMITSKKPPELYSDYQVQGKEGLIFAVAPQKVVDEYTHLLEASELEPHSITSPALAIANLLLFMDQEVKGGKDQSNKDRNSKGSRQDSYMSFLYITPGRSWLVITNQKGFFFSREILFQEAAPKEQNSEISQNAPEKPTDLQHNITGYQYLILEVARSFLYVSQERKGTQMSSLLVGYCRSLSKDIKDIIKELGEKLQLPVDLFDPSGKVNLGDTIKNKEEMLQSLQGLPVSLGLLTDTSRQISINLVPLRVREYKKQAAGRFLIFFFLVIYWVSLGTGYIGLNWAQEIYRRSAENQQQNIEQLKPICEQAKKNEQERRRHDFQLSIIKRFERSRPLWRGVLYELSLLSYPKVVLSYLNISESKGKWGLHAKGVISAQTSEEAKRRLKDFLKHLEAAVFFSHPKAMKISIVPQKAGGAQLNFTLSCNIMH